MFGLSFRGELPFVVERELDRISSRFRQLWLEEHNEDGTHVSQPNVHVYTPTLTSVSNSATETDVLSVAISKPFAERDKIEIPIIYKTKNNKGSSGTIGFDVSYGGIEADLATVTLDNSATEGFQSVRLTALRNGPSIYVALEHSPGIDDSAAWANTFAAELTSPVVTAGETLALKATLSAADTSFYFTIQAASVVHTQA